MSDLTATRDHARKMAAWVDPRDTDSPHRSGYCRDMARDLPAEHEKCSGVLPGAWGLCNCPCHPRDPGPTDAERALWTQIADEIDAYLSGPDDEPLEGM